MRRRGGSAAPAGACGVWLDTAELQRGPARPLSAKRRAPTRIPERKLSPGLLPQPGTRQSTIPSFFSPRADERDKENTRPPPCPPNNDCKDSGVPLAACPVKILALPQLEGAWEEPPGASRAWKTPLGPLELQGQCQSPSRASPGAGGESWGCSFSHKSQIFPAETASGSRKAQSRVTAGAGNTDPVPGAAPRGVCGSPRTQLFCQDSQGNRVIAHGARGSPSPSSSPSPSPSPSPPQSSQALFTQDSEGNRVIKHW